MVYLPADTSSDEMLANPDFDHTERVHDWRNYVGEHTQKLWASFTAEQRRAIALDAAEQASNEDWE